MAPQSRTSKTRNGPSVRRRSPIHGQRAMPTPNTVALLPHHRHPDLEERMAFMIQNDDAKSLKDLKNADLVFVGVSCTGKSTISKTIAALPNGPLVANVPIILGQGLQREVDALPLGRVIGLTANPRLIARARLERGGQPQGLDPVYADWDHIRLELMHAREIFRSHPSWPILDVLYKPLDAVTTEIIHLCSTYLLTYAQ